MKAVKSVCQVLALVFAVAALALFFTNFATINAAEGAATAIGAQLGFGSKVAIGETSYDMAISADLWLCFILTAVSAVFSGLSFKMRKGAVVSSVIALISGVYMLVIAVSNPFKFVDTRPLTGVTSIELGISVLLCALALLVSAVLSIAFILVRDRIEVLESAGKKKSIPEKVVQFLRDYKGEIKKIVWPGLKSVVRNTLVVLAVCVVIGVFIWVLDFGLAQLLNLILGI